MPIEEIIASPTLSAQDKITAFKEKAINVPSWTGTHGLENEYDPRKHPVTNKGIYPDIVNEHGIQLVTRVTSNLQQLAVKRMVELVRTKRIYSPENDKQKDIAKYMEKVYDRLRWKSMNNERLAMLYSGCEVMTLWYAVEQPNDLYGFHCNIKLRCANYSPTQGDELYPLFDEYGDLVALSVGYRRKVGKKSVNFFDAYTANYHIKYSDENGMWEEVENEKTTLGKIPAIYMYRPTPIWENQSNKVYEIEWALSRNGNYLRENSRPLLVVCASDEIDYGQQPTAGEETTAKNTGGFKDVAQFPAGSTVQYVTWQQAVENLKFYVEQLRSLFFTELQLPDWSYEKMSQQALSGESRKQMFIDAQLKVEDESGRLVEFFDREANVVKAFLKVMLGEGYAADIDALPVETEITPFTINDEKETIEKLVTANGNLPIISQRESIELLGWSTDADQTLKEISEQGDGMQDLFSQQATE